MRLTRDHMAKPFEVSAIKYSHREHKAEEWAKLSQLIIKKHGGIDISVNGL